MFVQNKIKFLTIAAICLSFAVSGLYGDKNSTLTAGKKISVEGEVNGYFSKIRTSTSMNKERYIRELLYIGAEAEETVLEYLDDRDKSIVIAAMRSLAYIKSSRGKKGIMRLTIHPSWEIRAMAVIVLGQFNDDEVVERIGESLLLDGNDKVKEAAAYSLCMINNPAVIEVFFKAFANARGRFRDACLHSMRKAFKNQSFSLKAAEYYEVYHLRLPLFARLEAVKRIGDMADRRTLSFFKERLKETNDEIRALAAISVGKIGDIRGIDVLIPYIEDKSSIVRENVKRSLFKITNFAHWSDTRAAESWKIRNDDLVQKAVRYEKVIEKALEYSPIKWENANSEIKAYISEDGSAEIFSSIIIRCILSENKVTNNFALHCFDEFSDELNPGLIYILNFGKTDALAIKPELARACELASIISYRYMIYKNIPHIADYLYNYERLRGENRDGSIKPIGYLCLSGMTGAGISDSASKWMSWWRRHGKNLKR